jgi:hypothetical protein
MRRSTNTGTPGIPLRRCSVRTPRRLGKLMGTRFGLAALTVALGVASSFGSARADCIDYGDYLHLDGGVDTPGYARGVAVSDSHLYIADDDAGLQVLPAQCESSSAVGEDHGTTSKMLIMAYPNPASPQMLIRFETSIGGLVQASVYDLAGRRVRRLSDGILGTGVHDLLWDGRNEEGHAVPAGVYLVRVSTAAATTTGQLVIDR